MRTFRIFLIAGICIGWLSAKSYAQESIDTTRLFAEFKKMRTVYQAKGLSFDIRYTYASEKQPDQILDSLNAHIDMLEDKVHYQIDSTETISNGRYNIALFKEDKIMYLSKGTTLSTVDPIQQIRSIIGDGAITGCTINDEGKLRSIRLQFGENGACREMLMTIDNTTGYMVMMRYIVKTELLLDGKGADSDIEALYGRYAIVNSVYNQYKPFAPESRFFDEGRFFYKEGDEFKPTALFSEYKIFAGSPGL
jgi:hypothetical protein